MRFVLGCLGVVFVIFGGCVLAIFGSEGVASDEVAFAIGALLLFSFGIWAIYKAITMQRTLPGGGPGRSIRGSGALTEFSLEAATEAPDKFEKLKIASATADLNMPETTPRRSCGISFMTSVLLAVWNSA